MEVNLFGANGSFGPYSDIMQKSCFPTEIHVIIWIINTFVVILESVQDLGSKIPNGSQGSFYEIVQNLLFSVDFIAQSGRFVTLALW